MADRLDPVRAVLLPLLAVALAAGLVACDGDSAGPEEGVTAGEVAEADGEGIASADVFTDPSEFVGRDVTVSGEVAEVVSARAFVIAAGEIGEQLLVFSATGEPGPEVGAVVRVEGTVREVAVGPFEEDFDVELEPLLEEFVGEVAVAADRVEVLEEGDGGGGGS